VQVCINKSCTGAFGHTHASMLNVCLSVLGGKHHIVMSSEILLLRRMLLLRREKNLLNYYADEVVSSWRKLKPTYLANEIFIILL
jgi:hypothetical protein